MGKKQKEQNRIINLKNTVLHDVSINQLNYSYVCLEIYKLQFLSAASLLLGDLAHGGSRRQLLVDVVPVQYCIIAMTYCRKSKYGT